MVRELTQAEREQGFTKIVHVRQAGRTPASGVETVDPETGKRISGISRLEFERRSEVGGRKFKGELFVEVAPRPEVEVSIRRTEEKKETRELAKKEAETLAREIAEGKIKVEDVVVTQKGAAKELQKILEKRAEEKAKFPTKEERIRETERKQRILETLQRQEQVRIREAQVQVQPQFITTTERVISPEELRRQEDERRIIGNGIDVGVGTGLITLSVVAMNCGCVISTSFSVSILLANSSSLIFLGLT